MSVHGVSNSTPSYQTTSTNNKNNSKQEKVTEDVGVVYEPSSESTSSAKKTYTMDADTVSRLKSELNNKTSQMQSLVEKLMGKQGKKSNGVMDLLKALKNGTLEVDADTIANAKSEIGDDGYWGVEKTSDRLVEMAKALSGGDPAKADAMIAAMEKGFKQATKAFGGDLPDICRQTIDAATQKINDWKNS